MATGRPKSGVWTYCEETDKRKCTVNKTTGEDSEASVRSCGKEFKGKYTTNLKKHLKTCHYEEYRKLQAEEDENKNGKYKYLFHSLLNDLSRTNQKPGTKSKSITFFQSKSESKLFSSLEPELKQNQKAFFKLVPKTITKSTGFSTLNYN